MKGITLYRKYRPDTFKEVLGQDHIVKPLESAVEKGDISHAYLFSGSRGTGKTSIARILARAIGCSERDVIEMDAASNRGIDDIRELRESVHPLPFDSKYKVYIIDEVHMLTKDAFNALLKTLEEPPEHVIFILATTEPEKLLDTVISRCQVYEFKKPTQTVLTTMAVNVAKKEGYAISENAADLIAIEGDGSFRDTLGILQKVITLSSDKKIDREEVETITGLPSTVVIRNIVKAVTEKDSETALEAVRDASKRNVSMMSLSTHVLRTMRFALLYRYDASFKIEHSKGVGEEEAQFLSDMAQTPKDALSSKTILRFIDAQQQLKSAVISELPLELAIMDLCDS